MRISLRRSFAKWLCRLSTRIVQGVTLQFQTNVVIRRRKVATQQFTAHGSVKISGVKRRGKPRSLLQTRTYGDGRLVWAREISPDGAGHQSTLNWPLRNSR